MKTVIEIENIKCGGCANSILRELSKIQGVFGTNADVGACTVTVEHTDEVSRETLTKALLRLGYPEKGSVAGMSALRAKVQSFASCAVGRIHKAENK